MFKIISVHSFRRGTGKTTLVASIAAILATKGHRVGVIDTDLQSPGIHNLFGLGESSPDCALNDYLWGGCSIDRAALDMTERLDAAILGKLYLVSARMDVDEIARVLRDGYDVNLLNDGCLGLIDALALDTLVIDTHAGLNEETLTVMAISDAMAIVLSGYAQSFIWF